MWRSIRWTVNLVVLAFAAYAFCVVPLGSRTGLEHARAILASDAAKDAQADVVEAARKLDEKVRGDASPAKAYDGPQPGAPLQRTTPAQENPTDPTTVGP